MKKNNMLSRAMWLCPVLKKGKGNISSLVIKEEEVSGLRRPTFPVNKMERESTSLLTPRTILELAIYSEI